MVAMATSQIVLTEYVLVHGIDVFTNIIIMFNARSQTLYYYRVVWERL